MAWLANRDLAFVIVRDENRGNAGLCQVQYVQVQHQVERVVVVRIFISLRSVLRWMHQRRGCQLCRCSIAWSGGWEGASGVGRTTLP